METQLSTIRNSVTNLHASVTTINGQIANLITLSSSVTNLEARLNTVNRQITPLTTSVGNLERSFGAVNATVSVLQSKQRKQPG